jgi:hypothetical protein
MQVSSVCFSKKKKSNYQDIFFEKNFEVFISSTVAKEQHSYFYK